MKTIFILLFGLTACSLSAQLVRGKVTDEKTHIIQDAIIYTGHLSNHTHTDQNGNFELSNVNAGDTIHVQYLGFEKYSHIVKSSDLSTIILIVLEEADFLLEQVYIDNSLKSINTVSNIDLRKDPVNSSQEILQKVPGLFIAQHAGGGKAEQIFLRGFDIDHGTDISLSVDGMPVNMVSHAHGQGYSDLHFVIPETIDKIDFGKGPYYADQGNFATAGYVDFKLKSDIDQSLVSVEAGRFNTVRTLAMLDLVSTEKDNLYLAAEYQLSDGPFESSQNFRRLNFLTKYRHDISDTDYIEFEASRFYSKWDASGQIPQRLVDDGTISRFGAVDDTEGGNTSRTNFSLNLLKSTGSRSFSKTSLFFSRYDFELYSNFTFFLDDPVNGDQIRQSENRNIFGLENSWFSTLSLGEWDAELNAGVGLRYDDINDNELSKTTNRTMIRERVRLGDIDESNVYAYVNPSFTLGIFSINPALRLDYFNFSYTDFLSPTYSSRSRNSVLVSPKLNLSVNPSLNLQVYLKTGVGFHSNDSRVIIEESAEEILPAAYSADLGIVWKPARSVWINAAVWYLELEQEFVYVGDAGIVEPSGRTRRRGIDLGVRYQLGSQWYFNGDLNYTIARSLEEEAGSNYIPLAPDLTALGGLYFTPSDKFSAGIKGRYIKNRPANEDNSIVARGYFVNDLNLNYNFNPDFSIGLFVENLFNVEWNEAQFATLSRLPGEEQGVEEIHFTPGVPFFLRFQVQYRF